jgi:glucose-6-phosphate 1-dehydrogenase
MKTTKILLMGITGDLAKRKVIPAISQFAERNANKFATELIGYSRSKVVASEVISILNNQSENGKHRVSNISFVRGQYDDAAILDGIFSELNMNDRLIIYLAIPPSIFIPFLLSACPLHHANIDIIIEKPFGQSLEEAENIIAQSQNCTLTRRIHFFDHYAFKVSSRIDIGHLELLKKYTGESISKIEIKALENVTTEGRKGYFDQTGSFKDMFQHIITMYLLTCGYFKTPLIDSHNIKISSLSLGQYDNYKSDSHNSTSEIDTYFDLKIKTKNGLKVTVESGKSLGIKSTSIAIFYKNGTKLIWNLDPEKHISVTIEDKEVLGFNFIDNKILDHTRLFESIVSNNFSKFVTNNQILETWKLYNLVNKYKVSNKIKPTIYKSGLYPIKKAKL